MLGLLEHTDVNVPVLHAYTDSVLPVVFELAAALLSSHINSLQENHDVIFC